VGKKGVGKEGDGNEGSVLWGGEVRSIWVRRM